MSEANIDLVDYEGGILTAQRHSIVTSAVVNGMGKYHGCVVSISGPNTLHITAGFLTIYGRLVEVYAQDFNVTLASTGTLKGRLYCVLDLGNSDNPCDILVETGNSLDPLPDDPEMNYTNGKSAFEIATFTVGVSQISNLKNVAVNRSASYAQLTDFMSEITANNADGYICLPGGLHIEFGKAQASTRNSNVMQKSVLWKKPFASPPIVMAFETDAENSAATLGENMKANQVTTTGATFYTNNAQGGVGVGWHRSFNYFAIGV